MWTPCPQILDAPVTIFGVSPEDFAVISVKPLLASLVFDAPGSFGCAALVAAALYLSKRGRAAGDLFHSLHAFELLKLPGLLPPRPRTWSPW